MVATIVLIRFSTTPTPAASGASSPSPWNGRCGFSTKSAASSATRRRRRATGTAPPARDSSMVRMDDEQVAVRLLGDLLAHAMTHDPLGKSRLSSPDDHEVGVTAFRQGHDRRGRIAGHGDGVGIDGALGEESRRVGELRLMIRERVASNLRAGCRGAVELELLVGSRAAVQQRRDAGDDHLGVEGLCDVGPALEGALGRLGSVIGDDDLFHRSPPLAFFGAPRYQAPTGTGLDGALGWNGRSSPWSGPTMP